MGRDVLDTCATHTDTGHDVTDTECYAQNGSTHGRVSATVTRCLKKEKEKENRP